MSTAQKQIEKKMKQACFVLLVLIGMTACKPSESTHGTGIVAKVDNAVLTQQEVEKIIPKTATSSDSLLIAESYIKKWVIDALTYDVAQKNLGKDQDTLDLLVEEYRRSLMRYRYQEKMVQNRLSAEMTSSDKETFYHENQKRFHLNHNLVKGLYLKVPVDAPGLDQVRKWYRSTDQQAIENIEKYSIQNAAHYEYFYDHWVNFDEILAKIPIRVSSQTTYLNQNRSIEVKDSTYCYFVNIADYLLVGNVAPYEYAEPLIQEMIINKRKIDFLKNFEEELYRDAIRKRKVELYTNQN